MLCWLIGIVVGGLLLLPAVWITHRTWIYRVRPLYKDIRKRRQQIDASTTETFGGIRVVRTFENKSESIASLVRLTSGTTTTDGLVGDTLSGNV